MFHKRSSSLAPDITALRDRVRALESEIERSARRAGERASVSASGLADQIADAVVPAVNEVLGRLRSSGRRAGEQVVRLGNDATRLGTNVGNDALQRLADEVEYRPLTTVAIAIGVGILIGMAGAKSRH